MDQKKAETRRKAETDWSEGRGGEVGEGGRGERGRDTEEREEGGEERLRRPEWEIPWQERRAGAQASSD